MKIILCFFLSLSFITAAQAATTTPHLLPGNNVEERLIRWLFAHRHDILNSCLIEVAGCGKNDDLRIAIAKTAQVADAETETELSFIRETDHPEIFTSSQNEAHRVAVTENRAGAKILFNLDRIPGLSIQTLAGLLFHELAHHTGLVDDAQRLPDQIGARVSQHLETHLLRSTLDEAGFIHVEIMVFQYSQKDQYFAADIRQPLTGFALLTDGDQVLDMNLYPFTAAEPCDDRRQSLITQQSVQPRWVVDQSDAGGTHVHMISYLNNFCSSPDFQPGSVGTLNRRVFKIEVRVDTHGKLLWNTLTSFLREIGVDDALEDLMSLKLNSFALSRSSAKPGEVIELSMEVQTLNHRAAKGCSIGYANSQWPIQHDNLSVMSRFADCRVTDLGNQHFRLTAHLNIVQGMAAGDYRVCLMALNNEGDPDILRLPAQTGSFRIMSDIQGGDVAPALSVDDVQIVGLTPLTSIAQQKLKNSYRYSADQEFDVQVVIHAAQAPIQESLGIGLAQAVDGEIKIANFEAAIQDMAFVLVNHRTEDLGGGQYRLTYRIKVPSQVQGHAVYGLWIERVMIQDGVQNWMSKSYETFDHMVFLDTFVAVN